MASEATRGFLTASNALLGMGAFVMPYAFRVAGAGLCCVFLTAAAVFSAGLTDNLSAIRQALAKKDEEKPLSEPLLTPTVQPTSQRLGDILVDLIGLRDPAKRWLRAAIDAVVIIFLVQVSFFYIDFASAQLSLSLGAETFYPYSLLFCTVLLWKLTQKTLAERTNFLSFALISKVMLVILVSFVSVASGRLSDAPAEGELLERLTLLPAFLAFFVYQLPFVSDLHGNKMAAYGQKWGIFAATAVLLTYSLTFSALYSESPHLLKEIQTLPFYGVPSASISYYAVLGSLSVLILMGAVANSYLFIQPLTAYLQESGLYEGAKCPVVFLLSLSALIRYWLFPGYIEDLLFLDPYGAMGMIMVAGVVSYAGRSSVFTHILLLLSSGIALCDVPLSLKVIPAGLLVLYLATTTKTKS